MANTVSINTVWCKKCGLCAHYCPKGVFELDKFGAPSVKAEDRCIGCMQCEIRCPDFAVTVEKK